MGVESKTNANVCLFLTPVSLLLFPLLRTLRFVNGRVMPSSSSIPPTLAYSLQRHHHHPLAMPICRPDTSVSSCLIHCHPAVYTRASRPHYAACSHLPAANECAGIHGTARLLLTSAVIGRGGLQVWRRCCQTGFKAGAPDGVCICAFIHSFTSHLVLEPFDNMQSNPNGLSDRPSIVKAFPIRRCLVGRHRPRTMAPELKRRIGAEALLAQAGRAWQTA